ncbi:MAG: ECF transporter S component [Ruminococcus sp.]|nr:ECF transporter S component [Ruminococcus sp.]
MKSFFKYLITILLIPLTIFFGVFLFGAHSYPAIMIIVAMLACVPFFLSFEGHSTPTRKIVLLAVMTALSVAGRFMFAPIPFFKPVTAIVIISAMYFGSEFGFLTGALSALISNLYFGQGPWTPLQMFSWGIIGFIAGLLSQPLIRRKIVLVLYAVFAGLAYSMLMDVWTAMWAEGTFSLSRFIAAVGTALPITAIYVISNVIFLLVLTPFFERKIERLKTKYGI